MTENQNLVQFTSRDKRVLWIGGVVAVLSLIIAWLFFADAFPEASIHFEVDKSESETIATQFLEDEGLSVTHYHHAAIFDHDDQAKVFLERTVGLEKANELMSGPVRVWYWNHRWFQSKQKEEYKVQVSPSGAITYYRHILPEDAKGKDLSTVEARQLAEQLLTQRMKRSLNNLKFIEHASEKLPNRTDHTFTWERTDIRPGDTGYRYEVTIQGDQFGEYHEYLKIPESWNRDYQQLRSSNQTAGTIDTLFLFLTILAMLVILFQKSRHGDIKWKTAIIFGAVAFVLMVGSQLNSLPLNIFNYNTTDSYTDFITQQVLMALLNGLLAGGGILFLTAAAEPLYRERYKKKLSLSRAFTLQGIKTKRFFIAAFIGLVLTFFFFAYQTVFYLIASKFGAWSPADIPYSDLLNTAVPWVFVLLMGFFPAVSEEFMSRMFSIPFLEKYLKVRWLAVLIPAFIWGFGHATYPNQPFWIRGVEVGMAGVIIGVMMLKFGIVATLIWHYTVDALYTAFLMFQSGDVYLTVSGGISAGIFLIPLGLTLFLYFRNGGFLPESDFTNEAEGVAPPKPKAPPKQFEIHYKRLAKSKIIWGFVLGFILLGAFFLNHEQPTDFMNFKLGRAQISQMGEKWLASKTDSTDLYKSAITVFSTQRSQDMKYLLEHTSVDSTRMIMQQFLYPQVWRARYFRPLKKEEFRVHYHPDTGEILAFQHLIPESAPGDSLRQKAAVNLAQSWLASHHIDTTNYVLKDVEQTARPHRLDYDLTFEAIPSFWGSVDEGRPQFQMTIQGSEVATFVHEYKLPEDWLRTRTAQTLGRTVQNIGRILLFVIFGVVGIVLLVIKLRQEDSFSWRPSLWIGVIVGVLMILLGFNRWDSILANYTTTIPWGQFNIIMYVSLIVIGLAFGGIVLLGTALSRLYYPGSLLAWKAPERYVFARDSLLTILIALMGFVGIGYLQTWIRLQFPNIALFSANTAYVGLDEIVPVFSAIGGAFTQGLLVAVALGLLTLLWQRYLNQPVLRILLIVLILFAIAPPRTLTWAEWFLQIGITILPLLWALLIWLVYMQGNYLSFLMLPIYLIGLRDGAALYGQNNSAFIIHGIIVFAIFTLLWFWTLTDALRHRGESQEMLE